MERMFYNADVFNGNIVGWDVSNVTNFSWMFREASAFNKAIGVWTLSTSPITMDSMFTLAIIFNQSLDNWNVSPVTDMSSMFNTATAFNGDITTTWNTGNVTNMERMFQGAIAFTQDISGWDFTAVTNMISMFDGNSMSTANYDLLLVALDAQVLISTVTFGAGTSTYTKTEVDSGTTDGTTASKLVDSTQTDFLTTVTINDIAHNTTDDTYAKVTAIDSNTVLAITPDIMVTSKVYSIQNSGAAKAKESIINGDNWTITDNGGV
jgi:surface protein